MFAPIFIVLIVTVGPTVDTLEVDHDRERLAEEMIEAGEDPSALEGELQERAAWRIDLNTATEEAVRSLPGITPAEAAAVLAFRRRGGRFRSDADLRKAGLRSDAVTAIQPYIRFSPKPRRMQLEFVQRWTRTLDPGRGYGRDTTGTRYLGSPDGLSTRLRLQIGKRLTLGGTLDKDPGEPIEWPISYERPGFDFAAGYAAVEEVGVIGQAVLGDFSVDLAGGLLLGHGRMRASSIRATHARVRLRPHSSSREHGFFRGVGVATRAWRGWSAVGFLSRRFLDGRVEAPSWRLSASGLHRTQTELDGRRAIRESVLGAGLSYRRSFVEGALIMVEAGYETPSSLPLRRRRSVSGSMTVSRGPFRLALEAARREDAPAVAASLHLDPAPFTRVWLRALDSFDGALAAHTYAGVDGTGQTRRETSREAGVRIRPAENAAATLSSRWQRRPSSSSLPLWTRHVSAFVDVRAGAWLHVHLRVSERRTEEDGACMYGGRTLRCAVSSLRRGLRLQAEYAHSRTLRIRLRIETTHYRKRTKVARGMLMFQDIRWEPTPALRIDARLLIFGADDYGARLYAVENDLLYTFAAPALAGRGMRRYILARITPRPDLSVQIKYGLTSYQDVRTVGSGLDEAPGRQMRALRVQLRLRLGSE